MGDPRTVLRGGIVADGASRAMRKADVALRGGLIDEVGHVNRSTGDENLDISGRLVMPGFIDAHSHADSAVFAGDIQRSLLRQGVTSVIAGQDGVSYAPGDGRYASDYFAALNGHHPHYHGGGVAQLLSTYDGTVPLNVGYLIPAGTVRHEVSGYAADQPTDAELGAMIDLVEQGLADGALGLSTGLDYVPNMYATVAELAALCRPVARAGAIYVTHMRGGYEENSRVGVDEVSEIALATGVSVHISHYHGPSALLLELIDEAASRGVDATFDAYPYRRGCSLLAMPLLPPDLLAVPTSELAARLNDPALREQLLTDWIGSLDTKPGVGPQWAQNFTLAHINSAEYAWAVGLTVREAAARANRDPASFALDVLASSSLETSVVMKVPHQRHYDELAQLFTHPAHVAGSDGIYIGQVPHPRGWGTFAKFLSVFTRERGDFDWPMAAAHLSGRTAERFCLSGRGRVRPGYIADIVIVDPERVSDTADYEDPRRDATGIDDVFVGGRQVLADGELTGINPGTGLRRSAPVR